MVVGIHQPNYIPWIGYFYKMKRSDIFIFLDDVQYEKNGYADRNSIKTPQGTCYLKIPVISKGLHTPYNEIIMNEKLGWRSKHLKTIEMNYKRAPYFEQIMPVLNSCYDYKSTCLSEFNINLITTLANKMNYDTEFICSSKLMIEGKSTERLKNLILEVKGSVYLSGSGGAKYQEETLFMENGIQLIYSDFKHPEYKQLWNGFEKNLSILDALFNCGFECTSEMIDKSKN